MDAWLSERGQHEALSPLLSGPFSTPKEYLEKRVMPGHGSYLML